MKIVCIGPEGVVFQGHAPSYMQEWRVPVWPRLDDGALAFVGVALADVEMRVRDRRFVRTHLTRSDVWIFEEQP